MANSPILRTPPFPAGETALTGANVADYLELHCLVLNRAVRLSFAESAIRSSGYKSPDELLADTKLELNRRVGLMKTFCPYSLDQVELRPNPQARESILYSFMAALSLGQNIDNEDRKVFELLVTSLMRECVGLETMCVGFPRRGGIERKIRPAFEKLANSVCEEFRSANVVEYAKDMALDVASWFAFSDERGGFLVLIGQCATGDDWETKLSDLTAPSIRRVVDLSCEPLRYLATPHFATSSKNRFKHMSLLSGLLLDRGRVWQLLQLRRLDAAIISEVIDKFSKLY